MSDPLATVAFVPREQFSTTQRSLETLYSRTSEPFDLVCIDGGSPPAVATYLERAAREKQFTLLRSDAYLTPNQARNLALPLVSAPYVAFVDNDVLVSPGWLKHLVDCARETGAWVVGPLYFEFEPECDRLHMCGGECRIETMPDGGRSYVERHHYAHQRLVDVRDELGRCETELIEFHTVLVAMEAFDRLGPLDEGLMCNAEHGDLCLSVRATGGRVLVEPRSRITYAPPKRLEGPDLEFFRLRWSEAWGEANTQRMQQKWNLADNSPGVAMASRWISGHRRYALTWLPQLRRLVGRKLAHQIEKRLVAPWEAAANRRQFPRKQYGQLKAPQVRVVYAPPKSRGIAA